MTGTQARTLVQHLRQAADGPAPPPDRQLLERFAAYRDEAAFAALVRRHGGLVLGVCRRVLGNHADAEDAFQATFLQLARQAGSAGRVQHLAAWLHCVAYRAALKARSASAARQGRERQAGAPEASDPLAEVTGRELLAALDEELQ